MSPGLVAVGSVASASLLAIVIVFYRLLRSLAALRSRHALTVHELPAVAPEVSILVPARDEALNIEACMRSLLTQDLAAVEILVWDDDSSDATHAIASRIAGEDRRVRVFRGGPRPSGWIGKCHALHRLAAEARGRWLWFVDADTIQAPHSLRHGLGYALHHRLRALSCSGPRIVGSFWERVWEPIWPTFLFFWLRPDRMNDPRSPVYFAIGQWFLFERSAYDAIGGHEAVRSEIVEDCALVRLLKRAGLPYRMLLSTRLFHVRMYRGLRELWHGWSKNAYLALRLIGVGPIGVVASVIGLALTTIAPYVVALAALLGLAPDLPAPLTVTPMFLALVAAFGLRRDQRASPAHFWTLPLAGALAIGVIINSWWRTITGRPLVWKDRTYRGGVPESES